MSYDQTNPEARCETITNRCHSCDALQARVLALEALSECNKSIIEQKDKNREALHARVRELETSLDESVKQSILGTNKWLNAEARLAAMTRVAELEEKDRERFVAYQDALDRIAAMTALLGMETPYPMRDVLRMLADNADLLLNRYNYDGHGHEIVQAARDRAREYADNIDAALKAAGEGEKS